MQLPSPVAPDNSLPTTPQQFPFGQFPGLAALRIMGYGEFNILDPQFGGQGNGIYDDSKALQAAINAADSATTPVNYVILPANRTYLITTTINVRSHRTHIVGSAGPYGAEINFTPSGKAGEQICFNVQLQTAAEIVQGSFKNLSFFSNDNTTCKILFDCIDISEYVFDTITALNITGNKSVGIRTNGRDQTTVRNVSIYADRPIRFRDNPNFPTLPLDHWHFIDCELVSLDAAEFAVSSTIANGPISNLTFDGRQAIGGGLGAFNVPANGSTAINIHIANVRYEDPLATTDFAFNWQMAVDEIVFFNCSGGGIAGPSQGGWKIRNARNTTLLNCLYTGASGGTALDIDGANCNDLRLDNTLFFSGSVVSIANMVQTLAVPSVNDGAPVPATAWYSSKNTGSGNDVGLTLNGTKTARSQNVPLATGGFYDLPFATPGTFIRAIVTIIARDPTAPAQAIAVFGVTHDGAVQCSGTANTGLGAVGGKVCLDFISSVRVSVYNGLVNAITFDYVVEWS